MFDSSRDPVLQVAAAEIAYGARKAVDGLSLTLGPGELYALLGPNGAGKTTLVRAIGGRIAPTGGSVSVGGEDPRRRQRGGRPMLGLVPQQIALYQHLTARENLLFFARLMRVPRRTAAARADAFLERTGLADRAHSRLAALSGGMQRRINIGAALMHEPPLLVLDEPTVGVDPHAREAIHDLLADLRADGLAILLTTHDMQQAHELASRVGIIQEGRLLVEGTAANLIEQAFGGGKEVVVTLRAEPGKGGRHHLEERAFRPMRGQRVWSVALAGGYDALSPLADELRADGLEVEAISLREPTLGSVFFQLVGRELDL